jgi:hypothetical protein
MATLELEGKAEVEGVRTGLAHTVVGPRAAHDAKFKLPNLLHAA